MFNLPKKLWYVIRASAGCEKYIVQSLQEHIKLNNMENLFGEILVPTEEVIDIRRGSRRKIERKFFPGYILIQMIMNDASWHLVRSVPRVMGFIGGTIDQPVPLNKQEVQAIMKRLKKFSDQPRTQTLFDLGEVIRIKEGPFADFNGIVEEIDYEKSRLEISVSIFGRTTPLELNFSQVEKF